MLTAENGRRTSKEGEKFKILVNDKKSSEISAVEMLNFVRKGGISDHRPGRHFCSVGYTTADTVPEFHAEAPQAAVSEGLTQGPISGG